MSIIVFDEHGMAPRPIGPDYARPIGGCERCGGPMLVDVLGAASCWSCGYDGEPPRPPTKYDQHERELDTKALASLGPLGRSKRPKMRREDKHVVHRLIDAGYDAREARRMVVDGEVA